MKEKEWKEAVQMYLENRSFKEIQERFDLSKDRLPELKIRALEERTDKIESRLPL
jgi:hypothetical protein